MNPMLTRRLLDAFYDAGSVSELMPPLPEGMTAQYVHVLDAIAQVESEKGQVRVSDVAHFLHVQTPGVTRSLRAMERLGAVEKEKDAGDRRVVRIALTPLGQDWYARYVVRYHEALSHLLSDIPEEEAETTVDTIGKIMRRMREHPITLEEKGGTKQ
ncbi:MAG: MarR family winged helix-turn-helix transcriptional regulator [Lachnospiraceae bacterium]